MHSRFPFALVLVAAGLCSLRAAEPPSSVENITSANNSFCVDLYRELGREPGNVIASPFSIHAALAMSYGGAREQTAREMADVLHLSKIRGDVHAGYRALLKQTKERSASDCEIVVANSLFAQTGYPFLKPFQELLRGNYDSGLDEIDLTGWPNEFDPAKAAAARKQINEWVAAQTRGKISEILPLRYPDPLTRLILVNAVWFKGKWATPFQKTATTDAPFYLRTDMSVPVLTMNHTASFGYAERDGVQVLRLSYVSGNFSMIVCLPKKPGALAAIEKVLSLHQIEQWVRGCKDQDVAVSLPRFRLASAFDLEKPLKTMGMKQAFAPGADFSGIAAGIPLHIEAAIHKACVDVDEEGTEAAASTAVLSNESIIIKPVVFKADHPFLFLIRDDRTGLILFFGRVVDPSKE